MVEFVLYGGKGGVGKTTCAAATGLKLVGKHERVLVVSTDPAHSLGDVFETELGDDPTRLASGLWGVEPSPDAGQATYQRILTALASELRAAGIRFDDEEVERLFTAGLVPGSDELSALQLVASYAGTDEWDHVVFDTAPTGHTLRLLALPEVLAESLTAVAKVRREVRSLVRSARSLVFGPAAYLGSSRHEDDIDELRAQMEQVAELLRDTERTEFRVVLVPERLAIEESRRLVAHLRSYGVPVETLVVNRFLEDADERCDRCRTRKARHEQNLARIRTTFPDLSVQVLPELETESFGRTSLGPLAERIRVD